MNRQRRPRPARPHRPFAPRVEAAERRVLLATFTVTNVLDNGGVNPTPGAGTGTFRQAIVDANNAPGADTIDFSIAGDRVIRPESALPALTSPVTIDARSSADPSMPGATLDGRLAGSQTDGLVVAAGGNASTIEGLVIVGFGGNGIVLDAGGVTVRDNFIGTDPASSTTLGNGRDGVRINSSGNTIGGPSFSARNVISGNGSNGISINAGANQVLSNIIGLSNNVSITEPPFGFALIPNRNSGVEVGAGATGVTIGGPGSGNLIAANLSFGIALLDGANNAVIQGNAIGTTLFDPNASGIGTGSGNTGNNRDGIVLSNVSGTLIGGTNPGEGNVISGNQGAGVSINGNDASAASPGNTLQGNFIGTDISGTFAIANLNNGVVIESSVANTIGGGFGTGAGNVISANVNSGVLVNGSASNQNQIAGNFIGTDIFGTVSLGNTFDGVTIVRARNTIVGGMVGGPAGNIISGNRAAGVDVLLTSPGTLILGNTIGLSSEGTPLGNGGDGVALNAAGNTVGGLTPDDRNVISGNQGNGIFVSVRGSTAAVNQVLGNYVGLGPDGRSGGQGNQQDGILLLSASGAVIGGTAPGAGNVITGNRQSGIRVAGTSTAEVVQGNIIGLNADGRRTGPGNFVHGVFLDRVSGNTIGGTAPGAGNVISGNGASGVSILVGSTNTLLGNRIGTDPTGTAARGNAQRGVLLTAASNNIIGGTVSGAGNLISGNDADGIVINGIASSTTTVGGTNRIEGNLVGTDVTGLLRLGNGQNGVAIFDSTANTIGGATLAARNVLSANGLSGVLISGAQATANTVQGNLVGTDRSGALPLGNQKDGLLLSGASGNIIGGPAPGAGNVFSGNASNGVEIGDQGATGNTIAGNKIGTDLAGALRVGNAQNGVFLASGAVDNLVGGTNPGAGNVISGNAANGVSVVQGASRIVIQGNIVGTDAAGLRAIGNSTSGIALSNTPDNQIGGSAPGAGNLISGNLSSGVFLFGTLSTGNRIQGNTIGTNAAGAAAVGNSSAGVTIDGASGNLVGGSTSTRDGNLVSGNATFGVALVGGDATGNTVAGNKIGTDRAGGSAIGNAFDGVLVNAAPGNLIGGPSALARNLISGNGGNGVNALNIVDPTGPGVSVVGNLIGTDATGLRRLGNQLDGVLLNGVDAAAVVAGALPNVIAANGRNGIESSLRSKLGVIQGNLIGTDANGAAALGNGLDGILLANAFSTLVGGATLAQRNVVSASGANGIHLLGSSATGDTIQGNYIGTDVTGTKRLANRANGIAIEGAGRNLVGGPAAGAGNLVSANLGNGILISGATASGNVLRNNTIGTDAAGSGPLGNLGYGISIEGAPLNTVAGSLISANAIGGIQVLGGSASGNLITDSTIGTDRAGARVLGNIIGVFVNGAPNNVIRRSLISGNSSAGIYLFGRFAAGNRVEGNRVGTDAAGMNALTVDKLPAQQAGVLIVQSPGLDLDNRPAPGNMIGGADPAARNVLSGNISGVVLISGDSRGNTIAGNFIGVGLDGRKAVPNDVGVYLNGAPANVVGGSAPNVISGNRTVGVYLLGNGTAGNRIAGNLIGLDSSGTRAVPNQYGVYLENAPRNTIGGTRTADRNVISGNSVSGVYIVSAQSSGNVIQGNLIGTNLTNTAVIPNLQYGVLLFNASNNTVTRSGPNANVIVGSGIANFREFTGRASATNRGATAASRSVRTASAPAVQSIPGRLPRGPRITR